MIGTLAQDFNFTWCGFQHGWPKGHTSCLRADAELEINYAPPSWAPDVFPMTRCLVQAPRDVPPQNGSQHEIEIKEDPPPTTTTSPRLQVRPSRDRIELPCPRDPRSLMRHIWKGRNANLLDCLALPSSLRTGDIADISKADLAWMMDRSIALQKAGFANMMEYFKECRNHPHEEYARKLYADRQAMLLEEVANPI